MKARIFHPRSRTVRAVAAMAIGAGALAVAASPALSGSSSVSARWVSQLVTGPECASPAGLCMRGVLKGELKGTFEFTAAYVHPTADTPTTGVLHYGGDMVITTDDGTLTCKDSGSLSNQRDASIVGICVVIGGTGRFAGASGHLRSTGTWPRMSSDGVVVPTGQGTSEGTLEVR